MQLANRLIDDFKASDRISKSILILNALALAAVPMIVAAKFHTEHQWDTYAETHQCKVVVESGRAAGFNKLTGSDIDGILLKNTMYALPRTGWQCNNGMTYWR